MKNILIKRKSNQKGITLIALVITIIVLLILAGVSIAMLTGQNGILTQAQNASKQTDIGKEKEQIALAYNGAVLKKAEEGGSVTADDLKTELEANGAKNFDSTGSNPIIVTFNDTKREYMVDNAGNITGPYGEQEVTQPTEGTAESFEMKYGVIEIKWLTGNTNYSTEEPNTPVIKEDLPEGTTMKLVKYDETNGNVSDGTDYDYDKNKWANAEVEIDGVKSYFVWIPRYAYKITYFDTPTNQEAYRNGTSTEGIVGYSDSRGIVDKNGKKVSGVTSEPTTNVGDYFKVHPAFTSNPDNGGWNEELPGIWVGKYESSLVNKTAPDTAITSGTNIIVDSSNNTDKAIAVKPNMSSWRNCIIGNFFASAKAYSTNLNSHMLKNSEWGAVAYLTESKYGRNGVEVTQNTDGSFLTASGDIATHKDQSSTGNVTGIYDLSGGAYEYVAAYLQGGSTSNGNSLVNETEKKYVTAYTGTNVSTDYKPGDATCETSVWHGDNAYFVVSDYPFFIRGGYRSSSSASAGVFYFSNYNGVSLSSFRVCLAVK